MFPPIRAAVALLCLKSLAFCRAAQRAALIVFVMTAALAVTVPAAEAFAVNTTLDAPDAALDGNCSAIAPALGLCTLRAAIQEANANAGSTITFAIPLCLPCTIMITLANGSLPPLSADNTTIDGFSQPGSLGTLTLSGETPGVDKPGNPCQMLTFLKPEIAIDANGVPVGLSIGPNTNNITIKGLAIYDVGVLGVDSEVAIEGQGGLGTNRVVESVFVGLLPTGTTDATLDPGLAERNLGFGVRQFSGTPPALGVYHLDVRKSLVGFNGRGGIDGVEPNSVIKVWQNEVFKNGWNSSAHDGVDINGRNGRAECNLSRDNVNLSMVTPTGGSANGFEIGSDLFAGFNNNIVRFNSARGNLSSGFSIRSGPLFNSFEDNLSWDNEVGFSINVERMNGFTRNDDTVNDTARDVLSRNSTYMNNGLGIDLQGQAAFDALVATQTDKAAWSGMSASNTGPNPTGPDGVTPNDSCDVDGGSNHRQNWPLLDPVIKSGTDVLVSGTLDSTPGHTFVIEFFATPDGVVFGSDDREGQRFLGQTTVTTAGSPNCSTTFSETLSGANDDDIITATATDITPDANGKPQNDTSEFSNPRQIIVFGQKVTGGGFIDPPAGTFICNAPCVDPDPSNPITRANFGVNAQYKTHTGSVPQGHTNFRARGQDLHLSSTEYEDASLAIFADPLGGWRFEWRGKGKLNGDPGYCFQVNGRDEDQGNKPKGTEEDKFRIKIWAQTGADCSDETNVIYDNDPSVTFLTGGTTLSGGNLEVHN